MSEQDGQLGALVRSFRKRISLLVTERMACWGLAIAGVAGHGARHPAQFLRMVYRRHGNGHAAGVGGCRLARGDLGGVLYVRAASPFRPGHRPHAGTAVESQTARAARRSPWRGATRSPWLRELVAADALAHAPGEAPQAVFPRKFSRHHKVALVSWAAVAICLILPHFSWLHSKADLADRAQMRETGKTLQHILQELKKSNPQLEHNKIAKSLCTI